MCERDVYIDNRGVHGYLPRYTYFLSISLRIRAFSLSRCVIFIPSRPHPLKCSAPAPPLPLGSRWREYVVTISGYVEYHHSLCPFAFHVRLVSDIGETSRSSWRWFLQSTPFKTDPPIPTTATAQSCQRSLRLPTSEVIPRRHLLNPIAKKAHVGDLNTALLRWTYCTRDLKSNSRIAWGWQGMRYVVDCGLWYVVTTINPRCGVAMYSV